MPLAFAATKKIIKNSSIALLFSFVGQFIALRLLALLIKRSEIFSPLYTFCFLNIISAPILFKILITPILEGLTFTSFISSFEFFDRIVKTIKKALELISPGIL